MKKIKDYELVRIMGGTSKCCFLSSEGNRCKKRATIRGSYHGDPEIMYGQDNCASWVQIELCELHAQHTFFSSLLNLPIIIREK